MKKTYKFVKPIKINNEPVSEIEYDEEEITVGLFAEACDKSVQQNAMKEFNEKLHLNLFWAAVIAVNPNVEFTTLNQIRGIKDIMQMTEIGEVFTRSWDNSDENTSDELSGITPDTSTPASATSASGD